jgi:hypothetical protein
MGGAERSVGMCTRTSLITSASLQHVLASFAGFARSASN